ncbi:MAG: alpha/beta hydrolase [Rhodobiaceae bacterium]|nr:alpha/beta hydrolase [Rhodobiaceae bacterium]
MDYEAEYNNRGRVPDHAAIVEEWLTSSEAARAELAARAEMDLAYDTASPRTTLDLFWPEGADDRTPVAVFIHGGYWRSFDNKAFSFVARGLTGNGVAVALPTYDLCPAVSMAEIVDEVRRACVWLYRRLGRRFAVGGHSAGGHLTAAMLATDWAAIDPALPQDLVRHGMPISGLFELETLIGTTLNADLRLDAAEARRLSPLDQAPPKDAVLDIVVGGDESRTFIKQSRDFDARWSAAGAGTRLDVAEGANHFSVILPLGDPHSDLSRRFAALARAAAAL